MVGVRGLCCSRRAGADTSEVSSVPSGGYLPIHQQQCSEQGIGVFPFISITAHSLLREAERAAEDLTWTSPAVWRLS